MPNFTNTSYLIVPKLMKNTLEQISHPILFASIDGYFYYVNSATIKVLGYSEEQFLQKTVDDIFFNLKTDELQKLSYNKQIIYQDKIITADNELKYFEVQASYDAVEEVEGISLILRPKEIWEELEKKDPNIQYQNEVIELIINNIPEQKRNQQLTDLKLQLQKALDTEEEINKLKTNIITTISHEYRTPLSKILMATHLLKQYREQLSHQKWEQYLENINISAQYLNGIINNIVYLNKLLYDNKNLDFEKVDLVKIYQESIIEFKNINYEIKFYKNQNQILIQGNPNLLSHLIKNLLANAFLYSEEGTTVITKVLLQKDYIVLQVIDQGIGIPSAG